jgi:hypothetical protein
LDGKYEPYIYTWLDLEVDIYISLILTTIFFLFVNELLGQRPNSLITYYLNKYNSKDNSKDFIEKIYPAIMIFSLFGVLFMLGGAIDF